jgi:hypothetical protein
MPKKPKKNVPRKEIPVGDVNPATGEDKRGDTVTVGWMLAMLATTAGDILAVIAALVMPQVALSAEKPELALALPNLLLFVAASTGIVVMLLTPVVYKFRRTPPPPQITGFGFIVSLLPLLALLWRAMGSAP